LPTARSQRRFSGSPIRPIRLLDQAAMLSTCNRVELYGVARSRPLERRLASFLAQYQGVETSEVASKLYVYRDDQVAQRLAETAAGMHSLVLGEAEVQGQIHKALADNIGFRRA
jgi:glutamyl-tRNA reductase